MPKGRKSEWLCIRRCVTDRIWEVGTVITATEPPAPRHFELKYPGENAITVLRRKIEDFGIEWDDQWDEGRLLRELAVAEDFKKKREKEKAKRDDIEIVESGRKADQNKKGNK